VHSLRPGDIDVIGGIGDSLTAGTGSFSYIFPQLLVNYRGASWIAGIKILISSLSAPRKKIQTSSVPFVFVFFLL